MHRALILYATREGQTEKIATKLFKHLSELGVFVALVNAQDSRAVDDLDLDSYDLLVFGASMHAGGLESELIDFIDRNAEQIELKSRSFFLVLLSAATKDPKLKASWLADARKGMNKQLAVRFEDPEMIAGALTYSKYSLLKKWAMKRIVKKAGEVTDTSKDYEYTDWNQVEQYAKKLIKV